MNNKTITYILAIETSCDETAIAILKHDFTIVSNVVYSQIKKHKEFGGVVPEYASRMHAEKIHFLIQKAIDDAKLSFSDLDAIAVTYGPGLEGALLVGLACAKAMAMALTIPLIPVNHLHGHIYAPFIGDKKPELPMICLIVSGGHTQLVLVREHYQFELIGQTRDDAAGEAFDKVARFLGLSYPGGPQVEKQALDGNPKAYDFPRAMKHQGFEFSFSGLKTAVIQTIKAQKEEVSIPDVCASFQAAVIDILLFKSIKACHEYGVTQLSVSGGVSANKTMANQFREACKKENIDLFIPEFIYCTDNAAMIGAAALFLLDADKFEKRDIYAKANLRIQDI